MGGVDLLSYHRTLDQGWAGMTFGHLGTGTGMAQPIPKLWERERVRKISFPTFGNGNGKIPFPIFGNGNGNSIPAFREREWDIVIPGNDREWERELHRKIDWKFFIIPLFNPTNILHCNCSRNCSCIQVQDISYFKLSYIVVNWQHNLGKPNQNFCVILLTNQKWPP